MSIFSSYAHPPQEDTYVPHFREEASPQMFFGGSLSTGFYATTEQPEPTAEEGNAARNYMAAVTGGKNWTTAGAWLVQELGLGGETSFVNRDAAQINQQLLTPLGERVESVGIGAAFADTLVAVKEVVDPNFSADSTFEQWKKDNAAMYAVFQQRGVADENFTKNVTNKVYFDANVRLQAGLIHAADVIDARNSKVTGLQQAWESTRGVLANYVLNDPVGLGVNVIPIAGQVGRVAGAGAQAAQAARLSLLGQSVVKLAPQTEAMLMSKAGHLALNTVEMSLIGMADDTIFQTQEVARSNDLWAGTDQALSYSFGRTALAGGAGMALSLGLHGVTKGVGAAIGLSLKAGNSVADGMSRARQAAMVAHGASPNGAVARNGVSSVNIARDYANDAVKVKIAEHLDNIAPNVTADPALGWVFDDKMLSTAGLTSEDVLDVVSRLSDIYDDDTVDPSQLNQFFQEWFVNAKGWQEDLGFSIQDGPQAVRYRNMVDRIESRIIAEGGVNPTDRQFIPGTREFRQRVKGEVSQALRQEAMVDIRNETAPATLYPDKIKNADMPRYMTEHTLHKETDPGSIDIEAAAHRANMDFLSRPNDDFVKVEINLDKFSFADEPAAARTEKIVADAGQDAALFQSDVEAMKGLDPATMPPIVFGELQGRLHVIDGRHRIALSRARKATKIMAYVPEGTVEQYGFLMGMREVETPTKTMRLQKELQSWIDLSKRRDLLIDEESRMMAVERLLEANNALPEGYQKFPTPQAEKGYPLNKMKPESEAGKNVMKLLKERDTLKAQTELLEKAKTVPGTDISRLMKDRDNTLARIRRVREKLQKAVETPSPKLSEILRDMAAEPPTDDAGRINVILKMLNSAPEDRGLRVQDIHAAAEIMRAWGAGESVARFMLLKTGQFNGTRSFFGSIRELFDFMDHATLKVEDMSPHDKQHVGTLADKKREAIRLTRDLDEAVDKALKSGKIQDWERTKLEFILHANNTITSTDPVVLDLYSAWEKAQKSYMQEGLRNGYLSRMTKSEQAKRFFPRRWLIGLVRRNVKDFQNVMYENFLKHWQTTDGLHMDTFVMLGWAKRTYKDGRVAWEGEGIFRGQDLPMKKQELDPALLPVYEKGLTAAVDANGQTALQNSAWRTVNNILSEDTVRIDQVTGKVIREDVSRAASELEQRIPEDILNDPRIHKFLDTNIMDLAQQYAEGTGFAIKAQTAVQQKLAGLEGATIDNWMDAIMLQAETQFRGDPKGLQAVQQGIATFRTKYLRMRGKSGSLMSVNEDILESMAQVGEAVGSAMYSPGIAILSMFADTFVSMFSKVHSPADFFKNIANVFQAIFAHKGFVKEHLHDLAMGSFIHRHGNIERYTSGQLGSTFAYSWGSRMANPWKEVVNAFSGKTQGAAGTGNRATLGSVATLNALAKNASTLFGGDFWFTSAAAVHVAAMKRETSQYLNAAFTLAKELTQGGWDELAEIEQKATADALARGLTREDAVRVGQTARGKAFNLNARAAGFGPNWHVAVRLNQHGLLDPKALEVLMDAAELTGGLRTKGIKSWMDLNLLAQAGDRLPVEKQMQLQETLRGIHNMIEADANKMMNVPGILQTPTDPSSRVYLGRMFNMYTGYMRTFANNHVLGLANVPQRRGFSLIVGFLIGETLARTARRLLNGEPWSDIESQWEENPGLMMTRTLMQVPFFGEWTMAPQLLLEAGMDGPLWKQDSGSIPQGALNDMFQLAREGVHSPYELAQGEAPRVLTSIDRLATRMAPGLGLARSLMGADMSRDQNKKRKNMNAIMERNDLNWERQNNWDDTQVDTSKGLIFNPGIPGVQP